MFSDIIVTYRPPSYCEDSDLPVYKWTTSNMHFSVEELARILLTDSVPKAKMCTKQPVHVCHNSTFVVDLIHIKTSVLIKMGFGLGKDHPLPMLACTPRTNRQRFLGEQAWEITLIV